MPSPQAGKPGLLFVLSNDYGELSNALYLTAGYDFRATLLMPERLFAVNREGLRLPAHCYASPRDITDAVDRERADLVFLFSGYLYAINNLLDVAAVGRLVRDLRDRRCRVVTSDPFLGILSQPAPEVFSDRHPLKSHLAEHFRQVSRALGGVTRLTLVPPDGTACGDVSFFNPHIVTQPPAGDRRPPPAAPPTDRVGRRWVFVLSQEDYHFQAAASGKAVFDALLAERLRDAAREGREPVLIAPRACAEAAAAARPPVEGLIARHFCSHPDFQSLLLGAEHVFYWNIFSNSVVVRVANRLSVFFFDPGHMAFAIPPLLERGVERYYPDSVLPYLDATRPLAADTLARLAAQQEHTLDGARRSMMRSPPPDRMVELLLADEPGVRPPAALPPR